MHGETETTAYPRTFATLLQGLAVGGAFWILWRDGSLSLRDLLILACSLMYWGRSSFGMYVLLKRRFHWSEALPVTSLFVAFHLGFAYLGSLTSAAIGPWDVVACGMYVLGSYLNTGSEYSRHVWKKDPANKGKLYREGLFRYSMHINYLGDSILFTGFAMLTMSYWAYLVPAVMTLGFIFQHIPALDAYLAERYGSQFEEYAQSTKKFIPYVY